VPLLRGPAVSTHVPPTAADSPKQSMASVKVQLSVLRCQSPGTDAVMPSARLSGRSKTENA